MPYSRICPYRFCGFAICFTSVSFISNHYLWLYTAMLAYGHRTADAARRIDHAVLLAIPYMTHDDDVTRSR